MMRHQRSPRRKDDRVMQIVSRATAPGDSEYRGYRFLTCPLGKGWRVAIYAPGSLTALPDSPAILEQCSKDVCVDQAKKIVDALFVSVK